MSAMSRRKGASSEREACALLTAEFGFKVRRELSQSRDGGRDVSLPPFCIEVKRRARIGGVYDWMRQAQIAARDDETPVVIARADGEQWIVVMRFLDWARLAREEIACGGKSSVTMRFDPFPVTGGSPSSASEIAADTPCTRTED